MATRQIPWARVLVEGVVIVASILLAFGIDAWWSERQERIEERDILTGLKADFVANRAALAEDIALHLRFQDLPTEFEMMDPAAAADLSGDSAQWYVRSMIATRMFDACDGTLDAVFASGKLDGIGDHRLRDALVGWKSRVDDAAEEGRDFRQGALRVLDRVSQLGGPWISDPTSSVVSADPMLVEPLGDFPPPDLGGAVVDP
jgi:hypothetical protein